MRFRRILIPMAVSVLATGACGPGEGSSPAAPRTDGAEVSPGVPKAYPYTTPTPPSKATPLDGRYTRENGRDVVGGSGKCRRCPPYRLALGQDVLELEKGVFRVSHEGIGYLAVGHYTISHGRSRKTSSAWRSWWTTAPSGTSGCGT